MSSLERLPPDQRAVLTLVLQHGRSYDEIASMLGIDRAAVRERALAALDALGPSDPGVPPEQRALITDYLLGQLPDRVRDQVRERLANSASERAWARLVASELASQSLSEIPTAEDQPLATAASAGDTTQTAIPLPTAGRSRSSRGGGGILLAVAAVVVVVVVVIILVNNGSSSPKKHPKTASTPTTNTTTTSSTSSEHVIAEIALHPTAGSKAAGLADIVTEGKVKGVVVEADHLTPNTTHNAYAVWLSNPSGPSKLLGYVSPAVGKNGDLKTSGPLPTNAANYKEILVTLETTTNTTAPGPTVLAGTLSLKRG
jgi:hypothetical protein